MMGDGETPRAASRRLASLTSRRRVQTPWQGATVLDSLGFAWDPQRRQERLHHADRVLAEHVVVPEPRPEKLREAVDGVLVPGVHVS